MAKRQKVKKRKKWKGLNARKRKRDKTRAERRKDRSHRRSLRRQRGKSMSGHIVLIAAGASIASSRGRGTRRIGEKVEEDRLKEVRVPRVHLTTSS